MKHKLFTLFFALAASIGTILAENGTCGARLTWDLTDGVLTISGNGSMTNYSFESELPPWFSRNTSIKSVTIDNGVTSIGSVAFASCSKLTSVSIPNSITSIGESAFLGCRSLTSVAIPENVTRIEKNVFEGCSGLTSMVIHENVTSIGSYAFYNCSGLTSVTIPTSVTSIGGSAFYNCSGLTSVTIPDGVTSIGEDAFYNVPNIIYNGPAYGSPWGARSKNGYVDGWLVYSDDTKTNLWTCSPLATGEISIPNSVTNIGGSAFEGCSSLTGIEIPNSVTSIGKSAFYGCTSLTSVHISDLTAWCAITFGVYESNPLLYAEHFYLDELEITDLVIPDSVTSIGYQAFYGFDGLTSVTLSNSVTSIGERAFFGCSNLTSVTIPNSVTSISRSAFYNCCGLTSITIPNSVTSIGYEAFYNVPNIIYNGPDYGSPWGARSMNGYVDGWLVYSDDTKTNLLACSSAATGDISISDSVISIGSSAFYDCYGITSVTISNGVTSIGKNAFQYCSGLTSVTIGNAVTSIGDYAFKGCTSLTSVTINSNALVSDDRTISSTLSIFGGQVTECILGGSVTSIGANAFYQSGLKSVTIGNSVTSIGECAFRSCRGLTSVTIPNSVTSIGGGAFWDCSSLTSIEIPNGVTSIGINTFRNCSGLTSVTIGNKVSSIGGSAFSNCSSLTSVTIGNGVISINDNAFYGCTSLTSIEIPNSVTSVGENAFKGCAALTTLSLGENITTYGDAAFAGCPALSSIYNYRERPASLGTNTFANVDYFYCKLYVPAGSVDMYKSTGSDWKDFYFVEPIITKYSITFVNWDGTVLQSSQIEEGEMPAYIGETPIREEDDTYTYTFSGWTPELAAVSADATYTATYEATPKTKYYTITFVNWDGTELQSSQVEEMTMPEYIGETPVRPEDEAYTYTFSRWTPELVAAVADATYTATYEAMPKSEGIDDVQNDNVKCTKLLHDGTILILRGEKTYTIDGQEVK